MQKVNVYVHIWNELRSNDRFGINAILLIASTKVQQTHTSLWDCVGLSENKSLSVTINSLIALSPISMQYFSHRYFTTFSGNILAEGLIPFASK